MGDDVDNADLDAALHPVREVHQPDLGALHAAAGDVDRADQPEAGLHASHVVREVQGAGLPADEGVRRDVDDAVLQAAERLRGVQDAELRADGPVPRLRGGEGIPVDEADLAANMPAAGEVDASDGEARELIPDHVHAADGKAGKVLRCARHQAKVETGEVKAVTVDERQPEPGYVVAPVRNLDGGQQRDHDRGRIGECGRGGERGGERGSCLLHVVPPVPMRRATARSGGGSTG